MRRSLVTSLVFLIASSAAFGAAVSVNGTCQVGNCAAPDAVSSLSAPSTAFNFIVTLPNTDQYRIAGNINPSTTSSTVGITSPFTVTYLGNSKGTSSAADVLNLDVLQNFQLSFTLRNATESAQGGFGGAIAAGSNVQIQLVISGQPLPLVGPFLAPANFSFKSQSYSLSPPANPVGFDVRHIYTFAAGSGVGATIYNVLTPGSTTGGNISLEACDSSSSGSSNCQVIICSSGSGSTLPIFRVGPQPHDSPTPSACGEVASDGTGGTLPILVFDGGPVAGVQGGSTLPVLTFEGGGSTLPVLTFEGGGSTLPVLACCGGSTGTLPVFRSPSGLAPATAVSAGVPIEIVTALQSVAAGYTAVANCPDATAHCWMTIPIPTGNISASTHVAITAIVDPRGLPPGTYTANVAITTTPSVGLPPTTVLNLPFILAISPTGPKLVLSQTGLQFQAPSGATALPSQSVAVSNGGTGALSFTATASTLSGNWLTVSPASSTATLTSVQISIQANPAGLAPGTYSGLAQFAGPGVVNGTQSVVVTLTVSGSSLGPSISTSALVFVATTGASPVSQTVQLSNPSSQPLTASTSIAFASGSGWFTTIASGTTVTSAQPLNETIAVNPAGLVPGVYLGSLDIHLTETNTDDLVEVLLVVKGPACTPTRLLPVIANLGGGFQETAGIPVPLVAQVVDDCGTPLTSGAVMAYFPGGDRTPLTTSGQGQWSGTWMPHSTTTAGPATVGIIATSHAPVLYGSAGVRGTMAANPTAPVVFSGGAVNSASYTEAPLAAGSRISIFGNNLATGTAENDTSPYPLTLGGTQVLLGGEALPLQVVANGQINAIVPYDLPIGVAQQLIVQQGANAMPETVVLAGTQPAVFTQNQSGKGPGVIVVIKPDGTFFVNSPSKPANAGDALVIYCTGLGEVTPVVPPAVAAPLSTVSNTVNQVTVTIGGTPVQVGFAGLAPGFVGAYQVNAIVPSGIAPGANVPLVLSAAGAESVPVTVAIQ